MNPLGDEAIAMLPEWWAKGPCVMPMQTQEDILKLGANGGGFFGLDETDREDDK